MAPQKPLHVVIAMTLLLVFSYQIGNSAELCTDLCKNWTFAKRRIKANFIDVSPYSSLKNGPKLALKWQIAKVQ